MLRAPSPSRASGAWCRVTQRDLLPAAGRPIEPSRRPLQESSSSAAAPPPWAALAAGHDAEVLHARRRPREGPSPCRQTEGTRRRRPRPHPNLRSGDNFHVTGYDPWAGRESTRGRYRDAPELSASRNPPHRRPARASTTPSTSSGPCARRGAARASCWSARSTSATCPKAWSTVCR